MRSVPKISKKAEQELINAVEELSYRILENNENPEDAVVSMVKSGEIKINHLPFVVYSYNNGMSVNILKKGTTPREKIASFPIIRLDSVLKKLGLSDEIYKKKVENSKSHEPHAIVDSIYLKIKYSS
jgi:hypothetical protein